MAFIRRTSIYGRRLALSSSGGIISSTDGSTDFTLAAVMRDSTGARISPFYEPIVSVSSSGASVTNSGVTILSSATATDRTFTMLAPVAGVGKEIISRASATTVTLDTSATTILFMASTYTSAGATSLVLTTLSTDHGNYGAAVVLRGMSATVWQIMSKPKASTAPV